MEFPRLTEKHQQLPLQMPIYDRDTLPPGEDFNHYRRTGPIRAKRVYGPFQVVSREGVTYCEDGWLALDDEGFPYSITNKEFERNYEPIGG